MNTDDRVRQCYRELRRDDARRVPPIRTAAKAPARPMAVPWLRLAAAVAVVAALVVTLAVKRQPAVDTKQWEALSSWQATTDELLTVPATPWGNTLSTPTDSWIQSATQVSQ